MSAFSSQRSARWRRCAKDAMREFKLVATDVTLADSAHGTTVVAFITEIPEDELRRRLSGLWRPEQ
jgi:hypothetical protein